MSLALYRSHRPKDLDELVGQDHIRPTLEALLQKTAAADRPPAHAILLTGPRGVGKTSVARIIARRINRLKATVDGQWLDIVEIDGASHNRVEQIRDLVDKARIAPSQLKYKVYIIDEVHTLAASQVSFQAFLKTLEEPPEHVVFILATTEIDKVPATIVSRCQRFAFRAIDESVLATAISRVAAGEKIKLDPQAAGLIARHSRGSLRDGLSILDQLGSLGEPITAETVRQSLGLPRIELVDQLYNNATCGDLVSSINLFRQLLIESGASVLAIVDALINRIRQTITSDPDLEANLAWLDGLIAVRLASQPEAQFEVALIRRATTATVANNSQISDPSKAQTKTPPKAQPKPAVSPDSQPLTVETWRGVVASLPAALKSIVAAAHPEVSSKGDLTLTFDKDFDANKLDNQTDGDSRRQKIAAAIKKAGFSCPQINIARQAKTNSSSTDISVANTMSQIGDIFGN